MDISRFILPAFASPVINYRFDAMTEVNAQLAEYVLSEEKYNKGLVKSNVGGWHSDLRFMQSEISCVQQLHSRLSELSKSLCLQILREGSKELAENIVLEGWANVLRYGQYNTLHCHPNAFWSGVYYVNGNEDIEGQPFSGKLELIDPRPGASNAYTEHTNLYGRFIVNPSAAQVVLFPSWMQHQVHPYFGDKARISIAFNILLGAL